MQDNTHEEVLAKVLPEFDTWLPLGPVWGFPKQLANKLKLVDYLAKHPEAAQRELKLPVWIVGLPRTGARRPRPP